MVSLRSDSLFNHAAFKEYVTDHPASTFVNERYEYLVVDRWKSRDEIAEIIEMGGPSGHPLSPHGRGEQPWSVRRKALLTGALDLIRAQGLHMVLVGEVEARRSLSAYLDAGFTEVEHIVAYRSVQPLILPPDTRLTVHPLTVSDLDDLVRLEQETFPWLWWFGVDEWLLIQMLSDVETFLAYADGTLVGYESHTLRRYTGHLDRLAIHPQFQGQGWGRELLRFALQRMTARGVRSIGLSTQAMNERAQRLYELHGFRREPLDLRMYGRILSPQGSELLAVNHV